ncbi:hypothetical protein I4U23_008973 [Adineta vaga]|nr:hypothetical protein I4U23_008973 [Adineta vaga]
MTAFARPSLIHDRYAEIAQTSVYTYDDDDLVNYAEFLQNHGRHMTKGGYVDSSRRIRSLYRQQDGLQLAKHDSSTIGNPLLPSLGKSSSSPSTLPTITTKSQKVKGSDRNDLSSSISTSANLKNQAKRFEKEMRLVKSEMIKAKKSEREVKRLEGDIKKEQQNLRQSLRKLDVDTTMKRYKAEKSLSKNLEEKDTIEREFVKTQEKQTRQRTDRNIDSLQTSKDKGRRNLLLCNDLARQYRTKNNELDIKHLHLDRLHTDFEQKVHRKELEQARLKKELGEIALALNLEAQKAKTEMKDFLSMVDHDRAHMIKYDLEQEQKFEQRLNKTNTHVKNYELERRRLSGDMASRHSMLDLKQREALRRIGDTRNRLETIYTKQRQLNANAAAIEKDRRTNQLNSKMNVCLLIDRNRKEKNWIVNSFVFII